MGPNRNGEHWEQGILQIICFILLRVTGGAETEKDLQESDGEDLQIIRSLQQMWRAPGGKPPMGHIC